MMVYDKTIIKMVMSIGMLCTMNCYGMEDDRQRALMNPVERNTANITSYSSYLRCPSLTSNMYARIPTRPRMSAETYERTKKTILLGSAFLIVGGIGYYAGKACKETTQKVGGLENKAEEVYDFFEQCMDVLGQCSTALNNLTEYVEEHCNQ